MQEARKGNLYRDFLKEICSWRALTFYKNNWLTARYPSTTRIGKVIWHKEAIEQRDTLLNYGFLPDKSESFFSHIQKLFRSIPLENTLLFSWCENSEYADQSMWAKNSYLSYSIIRSENILYTALANLSTNVFNSISIIESENIYRSHNIVKSFSIFFSKHINNSNNLWFCTNMIWCQECLFSENLNNKSYCIKNQQHTKEEYMELKKKMMSQNKSYLYFFSDLSPENTISISENTTGAYITNSSNTENWYYIQSTHNSKNVIFIAWWEWCESLHDTFTATW